MSVYRIQPPTPPQERRKRALLIGLLLLGGLLLFSAALFGISTGQIAFGPTPTPTATSRVPFTATPDFRATQLVEDMITQEAYPAELLRTNTPVSVAVNQQTPLVITATFTPDSNAAVTLTPGEVTINIPVVIADNNRATDTPIPVAPTATPTATPIPVEPTATPTDTALPTATPTIVVLVTPTPVATPTFVPSPTVDLSPTPTPTVYGQASMKAYTRDNAPDGREGPSSIYPVVGSFNANSEVNVVGRTESGEWVFVCCVDNNAVRWMRQAELEVRDNTPPDSAPDAVKENPNNLRWLNNIVRADSSLEPLPNPTPVPTGDFPFTYNNRANHTLVTRLPGPPASLGWPQFYEVGSSFSSPIVVMGSNVLAATNDGHLYSIDRRGGNQRWRVLIENSVREAPVVQGPNSIYIIDTAGVAYEFLDSGGSAQTNWSVNLNMAPTSSLLVADKQLFVAGTAGDGAQRVMALERVSGATLHQTTRTGSPIRYMAMGDQILYVAGDKIWGLDFFNIEQEVWTYDADINDVTMPPVYVYPGVEVLAELFVGESDGTLHILDANTGRRSSTISVDRAITGIAVDDSRIFVTGDGVLRAFRRTTREEIWSTATEGSRVLGHPLVDNSRVLVFFESGVIQLYDATSGALIWTTSIPPQMVARGAVSNEWIFAGNNIGNLYGLQGQAQ